MSDQDQQPSHKIRQTDLAAALTLAVLSGFGIGMFFVLRHLPTRSLSRADMERLLFYRYLREKGKLES